MKLYIIRHGETDWNNEKKLQGRSDIPLNDYGRELADITSEALKDITFDVIYSSPLKRALETAEILKRNRNAELITDDRLKEMCFGTYEGQVTDSLPEGFRNFFEAPDKYVPPEGGETYDMVLKRAKDFIDTIIMPEAGTDKIILVVAHGALNRGLMLNLNNQGIKDWWSGIFQRNCCVNIYEITEKEKVLLENGRIYYEEQPGKGYMVK